MADDDQRTEFFGSSTAQPEPPAPPPSYGYTPSRGDDLSTEQAGAIAGAPAAGIPDPDAAAGGPDAASGTAGPQQLGQEKPRPTRGVIQDYLSRSAKMSQEEYDANRARIDPKHQMDDGEAHLRIIADLSDPDKKVAAMQYGADQTDKGVALARAAADAGHMDKVTALLNHAYKYVPAAQGTTFDPTDTGMVINTPSGGRYGNPTNLTSDQVYALVHSGTLDFDAVQKNGLQSALQQATKQSASGEAGLGAQGAQGPGSTAPPPDEFGPTKQQFVGPDAGPRDANVPTPEKPGGGPLESFQEYGPTKQQIAPGYDRPTPRPTAPGSKDSGLTAEEEKPVRGISPEDYKRMTPADRAKLSKDERKYTRGEYFDRAAKGAASESGIAGEHQGAPTPITGYDVAGKWDPNGRYPPTEMGENSSAVAGGGSTRPPEGAPPNWQQQLGRGAPTQNRGAAFDRGAAGGSNPAAAGAQQFRQQLPSGGDEGMVRSPPVTNDRMARAPTETNDNMIRDPDNPERIIRNPSAMMRRAGQPGYDGAGAPMQRSAPDLLGRGPNGMPFNADRAPDWAKPVQEAPPLMRQSVPGSYMDPETGVEVVAVPKGGTPPQLGLWQAFGKNAKGEQLFKGKATNSQGFDPTTPEGYREQSALQKKQETEDKAERERNEDRYGIFYGEKQPDEQVPHHLKTESTRSNKSKGGSSSSKELRDETTHSAVPRPDKLGHYFPGGKGGGRGLNTDEEGRTAAERGAQETDWRTYYNELRKDVADNKEISPKDQDFMRWYENKVRNASGGGQQQPAQDGIPAEAIQMLRQNPHTAAQFDQMFGPGAARRVLGQ